MEEAEPGQGLMGRRGTRIALAATELVFWMEFTVSENGKQKSKTEKLENAVKPELSVGASSMPGGISWERMQCWADLLLRDDWPQAVALNDGG